MPDAASDHAQAAPTKRFFVSMLTRDIDLKDAILDLIDNCLDGALRAANGAAVDYSRHRIDLELNGTRFKITDDCGGIPREVARNYAFKLGREASDDRDGDAETIGMYGIGMKRAIFKMGQNSVVRTFTGQDRFKVPISSGWLMEPDWNPLPILDETAEESGLAAPGTIIEVSDLLDSVARQFAGEAFINDLMVAVAEHFTTFLQRGLRVSVNAVAIEPVRIEVLVPLGAEGPAPYAYTKLIDGVEVSIVVGLNSAQKRDDEEDPDEADATGDHSSAVSGWSIFCNDRAVIVGDKSRITGWGDGVPLFHPQFAVITGVIEFRSANADKLPVTTTKRALDTSSPVWSEARVKMREGLRVWTSHTNAWKNLPRVAQSPIWAASRPLPLASALQAVRARVETVRPDGGWEYNPAKRGVLPKPEGAKASSRRVVFSRPIEEIRAVSSFLFDREDEKPGVVGERCFAKALREAELP